MKKLLSVLATVGFIASSTVSVVACGTKKENKPEEPKKDITQVVQDFEQDVARIWSEHYEKEVAGNLIGVESMEEGNKFLNKYNIQKFSKSENKDKLTSQNKQQLTNDVEKLFKVKLLEEKLNELKKVNKYKIILDDVNSVFEHVELVFNDDFKINSGEIVSGAYIGNVVVDYKVVTHYKGLVDVEKFKQLGTLKYTSTESESFKKVGDVMYKNIAKDMFISKETQKYANLKWSDIKGEKQDYEAYVNSNSELKKYCNSEDFHDLLLKTINDKYFKQNFPTMEISYDKKSIYKTDNFVEQNKNYLVINNLYKSDSDILGFDLTKSEQKSKLNKILMGDMIAVNDFLVKDQFNSLKWSKIRSNYKIVQNNFLDKFLSKNEVYEFQKTDSYKLAIAMGYIDFVGPSIKIGKGELTYNHQMPDFKLAISYSMNGVTDENYNSIVNLSLKLFGIYKELWTVKKVEDNSYLLGLKYSNQQYIWNRIKNTGRLFTSEVGNRFLNDYSKSYLVDLEKKLSLLNMTQKTFASSNNLYSIYATNKNIEFGYWNFVTNIDTEYSSYFSISDAYKYGLPVFFKEVNYLKFDLFGIVKMKIYFDKTLIKGNIF